MKRYIFSLALLMCSSSLHATCRLSGYEVNYVFYGKNGKAIGNHTETLTLDKHKYTLNGNSKMQILWFKEQLNTTVTGTYQQNTFLPSSYRFHEARKNTNIAYTIHKGKSDTSSAILNCRIALLKKYPSCNQHIQYAPNGKSFPFSMDLSKLKHEKLSTAIGTLNTVKLPVKSKGNMTITYWLAKKYGYLPVKISGYHQGRIAFTETISSYTPENSAYCAVN